MNGGQNMHYVMRTATIHQPLVHSPNYPDFSRQFFAYKCVRNIFRQAKFAHIIFVFFWLFHETLKPYLLSNFRSLGKTAERAQSGITSLSPLDI